MSIKGSSFNNVDNRLRNFRKLGANSSYSDALSGISTISSVVINDATIFNARLYIASGIGLYKTFNSTDNLMIESPSVIDGNFTCVENKNGILLAGTNDGKLYYNFHKPAIYENPEQRIIDEIMKKSDVITTRELMDYCLQSESLP